MKTTVRSLMPVYQRHFTKTCQATPLLAIVFCIVVIHLTSSPVPFECSNVQCLQLYTYSLQSRCWHAWPYGAISHAHPFMKHNKTDVVCAVIRYQFCLARMELLPVQLREKVLQFQINTAAQQTQVSMIYIVSAGYDSIMTSMSWLPSTHVAATIAAPFEQAAQVKPQVHVYTGPAGSGKTHAVQAQLQSAAAAAQQTVQTSLNESASSATLIQALSAVSSSATAAVIAIHISTFAPAGLINQLLFQLLVEGVITDAVTGAVFALPETAASLLVEVPAPISAPHKGCDAIDAVAGSSGARDSSSFLQDFPVLADCASQIHAMEAGYANCNMHAL